MSDPLPQSVRQMWLNLTVVWAIAWSLGLLVFAVITGSLADRYFDEHVDSRLRIQAIAVYGLAFFDESGNFESGLLDYEDELFEPTAGIWFVEPDNDEPRFHLSDDNRFAQSKLVEIANRVVQTGEDYEESGTDEFDRPFRLLAIPTYEEDAVEPRAAIVVANNPEQINIARQRFLRWTTWSWILLGIVGIIVGSGIARWSLMPLAKFIVQREQFLSAAAHELRTPLASISAVVESGNANNESAEDTLTRLTTLVDRAKTCTENLLLYARLDAGTELLQKEPVRLDLLIEAELGENTNVQFDLHETIINGDARLLKAMIRNLLSNAFRHASNPRQVSVTLQKRQLVFQNDGEQFPDDIVARRQADFRISPSATGSGFGLAIVQMIVLLHEGTLTLSNLPNGKAQVVSTFE